MTTQHYMSLPPLGEPLAEEAEKPSRSVMTGLQFWFMIFANTLPVIGVLYWGWSLQALLVLYWLESLIIGVVNIPKILLARGMGHQCVSWAVFFPFNYGLACAAHGLFLYLTLLPEIQFHSAETSAQALEILTHPSLKFVLLSMFIVQVSGFFTGFLARPRGERLSPTLQMLVPYRRLILLQMVILWGAYYAAEYASITGVILTFAILKIAFEVAAIYMDKYWPRFTKYFAERLNELMA